MRTVLTVVVVLVVAIAIVLFVTLPGLMILKDSKHQQPAPYDQDAPIERNKMEGTK